MYTNYIKFITYIQITYKFITYIPITHILVQVLEKERQILHL